MKINYFSEILYIYTVHNFHFRTLTVKSVRAEFLKYLGIERLEAEQKELFKKSVHDIYAIYTSKQQHNGDQGK